MVFLARNHLHHACAAHTSMNHAPLMFPFDANCAVLFKDSVSATITVHEAMRVVYDIISGGCSIDVALGTAALGVVSSTIVLNGFVGSCTLSFTAYFGSAPAMVSSTQSNAPAISRTLIAHSVIPDPAFLLAAGPLTAGASYPFKREALLDGVFSSKPPPPRLRRTHFHESRAAHVSI